MPARERVYRMEAVVLRQQELGEADRLLTVYSANHGKMRLVAKGVRRPRSRKAGHLELFTRVALMLARGRDLDIVTQAEAMETFPGLRNDLIRLGHAAYAVELLDCFAVQEENRPLYRLLVETFERLSSGLDPAVVIRFFELRLLDLVGYRPELFRCVVCGSEVRPQGQFFSAWEGGILCPHCGEGRKEARPISLPALKVMRHFQRSGFSSVASVHVSAGVQAEIEGLMEGYLGHLLERSLYTPSFLRRVRDLMRPEVEHR